jgi:hypothetical protein
MPSAIEVLGTPVVAVVFLAACILVVSLAGWILFAGGR